MTVLDSQSAQPERAAGGWSRRRGWGWTEEKESRNQDLEHGRKSIKSPGSPRRSAPEPAAGKPEREKISTELVDFRTEPLERPTERVDIATGSVRQSTSSVRRSTGSVRQSTSSVRRSTSSVRQSTSSVRQSTGSVRQSTGSGWRTAQPAPSITFTMLSLSTAVLFLTAVAALMLKRFRGSNPSPRRR